MLYRELNGVSVGPWCVREEGRVREWLALREISSERDWGK